MVFFEPANLKGQIVHQVYLQTGQKIQINGKVDWILGPHLKVRMHDVRLLTPFNSEKNSIATAEKIDAILVWRPLISNRVLIKKVILDNFLISVKGVQATGDIVLDLNKQTVAGRHLMIQKGPLKIEGSATGKNIKENPEFMGEFEVADYQMNHVHLTNLHLSLNLSNTLNGNLNCERLSVDTFNFNNIKADIIADHQTITLSKLKSNILDGDLDGKIIIDNYFGNSQYNIEAKINKIKLDQLLKSDLVQGLADVNAQLRIMNFGKSGWLNSLNGRLQLSAVDGVINNEELIRNLTQINPWIKIAKYTPFSQLSATGVINNGLINNDDFFMQTKDFVLKGKGNLNLINEQLDYHFVMQGQAKVFSQKIDFDVPFKVTGNVHKPLIKSDPTHQTSITLPKSSIDKTEKKLQKILNKIL